VVNEAIAFFLATPIYPLAPDVRFSGSGVYALYYTGDFPLYASIANAGRAIYVGKAVAPGWRTARVTASDTPDLLGRLRQHAHSIAQATNLRVEHFQCQFVILEGTEGDLVVPVEAELIRRYQPLWNSSVDGFGNHDPGSGRYNQAKSEWDVLHPGRKWAEHLVGQSPNLERIMAKIRTALS
jgi:hypothetical protein